MIDWKNLAEGKTLYAIGDGNWDLYENDQGHLYYIAKPGTGCSNGIWGDKKHLDRLTRRGIKHGFTVVKEET